MALLEWSLFYGHSGYCWLPVVGTAGYYLVSHDGCCCVLSGTHGGYCWGSKVGTVEYYWVSIVGTAKCC